MKDQNEKPEEEAKKTDKETEEAKKEIGGPKGPEPTRYGDWEKGGKCVDF